MSSQDAVDIASMNSSQTGIPVTNGKRGGSKLIWIVLACVVLGVTLGVVVYQQSLAPVTKPSPTPRVAVGSPLASAAPVGVNEVLPAPKTVTFPKAGQLRAYWAPLSQSSTWSPLSFVLTVSGSSKTVVAPGGVVSTPMQAYDTGVTVAANSVVTINSYFDTAAKPSRGWILPTANKCGANDAGLVDITSFVTWFNANSGGETAVSTQCWSDYDPKKNNGTYPPADFNDYLVIWSYTPPTASASPLASSSPLASASPLASPSPSAVASRSPSPSPVVSPSVSPSPVASRSPSPSPSSYTYASPSHSSIVYASTTTYASPRVAQPDTTGGVPVTGVFEVTAGTIGIGVLLVLAGVLGLLLL
jgi:hypothetical protein